MSPPVPRIAFAGAAHSHAFADAANLRARGARLVSLWDGDDAAPAARFSERFGVPARETLTALLADQPDAVVATVRTPRAAEVASACALAGVPVFFNKTVAAGDEALHRWLDVSRDLHFTSSVLRFAPALLAWADDLRSERLHALDVVAHHDIAAFLQPERRWQDDPAVGGGTLLNIGVHAWEMIDVLLPEGRVQVHSARIARGGVPTASELIGTVHGAVDDVAVTVTVSGVGGPDRYAVRALTGSGIRELVLGVDGAALGYHGAAEAVLRLARGERPPVHVDRTKAVYGNALAAARAARG